MQQTNDVIQFHHSGKAWCWGRLVLDDDGNTAISDQMRAILLHHAVLAP